MTLTQSDVLSSPSRQAARAARAALWGELPPRYAEYALRWQLDFKELAAPALRGGASVLDVGGGRFPVFGPEERPDGVTYSGLDIVRSELDAAVAGSYDEVIAADVAEPLAALEARFDLIVSRAVFEHVRSVPDALDNLYAYLKPGGYAIISLSGRFSVFAILNMLLPRRLGVPLVARVMRREQQTVFPAYYHRCYQSALEHYVQHWSSARIFSAWAGASYFRITRPLQSAYIFYEEWAFVSRRTNLATHYFLQLRK